MFSEFIKPKEVRFFASSGWETQKEKPNNVHLSTREDYSLTDK